jgi:hypothetical protein
MHILTTYDLFNESQRLLSFFFSNFAAGMMISAFARAGQVLGDSSYIQRAVDAIKFVQRNLLAVDDGQQRSSSADGRLLRSCYVDSETKEVVQR